MKSFSFSPQELFLSFLRNRALVGVLAKQEIIGRYRGSVFGFLWSFLNPLLMLAVYTFIFSVVFNARWGANSNSKSEFALVLFAGLMTYSVFSESVSRASGLIIANKNYVKKIVFPLEILPWVIIGSSMFHWLVSALVWMAFYFAAFGNLQLTSLWVPVVMLPLVLFTAGLSWALASLGVYLRDVSQIVGALLTVMLFLSPVFYPVSSLPPEYQDFIFLNPITAAVEQVRAVMIWGVPPDFELLGKYFLASCLVCWLGFVWFQKTRQGFSDVL